MITTIQVDLDGLWVLQKAIGKDGTPERDSIYKLALERAFEVFDRFGIKATFFVVGKDMLINYKSLLLREAVSMEHEIASHGYEHIYLSKISCDAKEKDIVASKTILQKVLHITPHGFRVPGYDIDEEVIAILRAQGFSYDSSVFPTRVSPLLALAQKVRTKSKVAGYGQPRFANAPNRPYQPHRRDLTLIGDGDFLEVPVTVSPSMRFPIHFSYLERFIPLLMFRHIVKNIYKKEGVLNFVFHLIDFVSETGDRDVDRLCATKNTWRKKLKLIEHALAYISEHAQIVPTIDIVNSYFNRGSILINDTGHRTQDTRERNSRFGPGGLKKEKNP